LPPGQYCNFRKFYLRCLPVFKTNSAAPIIVCATATSAPHKSSAVANGYELRHRAHAKILNFEDFDVIDMAAGARSIPACLSEYFGNTPVCRDYAALRQTAGTLAVKEQKLLNEHLFIPEFRSENSLSSS